MLNDDVAPEMVRTIRNVRLAVQTVRDPENPTMPEMMRLYNDLKPLFRKEKANGQQNEN
jgi:hypothetical protein